MNSYSLSYSFSWISWILLLSASINSRLHANPLPTECIGPSSSQKALIYLHGLEEGGAIGGKDRLSGEEKANRNVLEQIAQKFPLRVALPQSSHRCAQGKRCWPGSGPSEVLKVYEEIMTQAKTCWTGNFPKTYALLGFSNGGYFAFKLYKAHQDPGLRWILASGSSGSWDPKLDKLNPLTRFYLMLGRKELTLQAAQRFASIFRLSQPNFSISTFDGGHQLHEATLLRVLQESDF